MNSGLVSTRKRLFGFCDTMKKPFGFDGSVRFRPPSDSAPGADDVPGAGLLSFVGSSGDPRFTRLNTPSSVPARMPAGTDSSVVRLVSVNDVKSTSPSKSWSLCDPTQATSGQSHFSRKKRCSVIWKRVIAWLVTVAAPFLPTRSTVAPDSVPPVFSTLSKPAIFSVSKAVSCGRSGLRPLKVWVVTRVSL